MQRTVMVEGNTLRYREESVRRSRPASAYTHGTAAPDLRPRRRPSEDPQKGRTARPDSHQEQAARTRTYVSASKHNRTRSAIRPSYMIFLGVALAIVVAACVSMLSIRSELITAQDDYEKLETQLQELRAENDSKEIYLNKSIDLNEVYKIATEELGMVYPSNDQVIYYERSDGGYVRQYEDIPTN